MIRGLCNRLYLSHAKNLDWLIDWLVAVLSPTGPHTGSGFADDRQIELNGNSICTSESIQLDPPSESIQIDYSELYYLVGFCVNALRL